jgi:hypothetical protein
MAQGVNLESGAAGRRSWVKKGNQGKVWKMNLLKTVGVSPCRGVIFREEDMIVVSRRTFRHRKWCRLPLSTMVEPDEMDALR